MITHIWFTIAAPSPSHLKENILRIYWDGNAKPSVEVPVGDFFGLNLAEYFVYQSAFLNCSSVKALNCYFAMPFRRSARVTVTNQSVQPVNAFYYNLDYQLVSALPAESLYFHAQYRQATPNRAQQFASDNDKRNLDGKNNYVFLETKGRGHLMGVTLGVLQNSDNWMGEGDEMIFVDNDAMPLINGTGSEDYFCGAWDFGGKNGATPFAHLYNGAPMIASAEREGGRYCLYRWHTDNPITFQKSLSTPSSTATPTTAQTASIQLDIGISRNRLRIFRRCRRRKIASPPRSTPNWMGWIPRRTASRPSPQLLGQECSTGLHL